MRIKLLLIAAATSIISMMTTAHAQDQITGAGATFPAPIYQRWAQDAKSSGLQINYQSIGSGSGINQIINRTVDFGATDAPLNPERLAQNNLLQIPTIMGSIVIAYNIPGVPTNSLRLTPELLVQIFMGQITRWNDPALVAINPHITLPRLPIGPTYRADGSGTTWIFTQYLSAVSEEWKTRIGAAVSVSWPAGNGARGNEGVSNIVGRNPGSIGYVESSFAVINNLNMAQLRNRAGNFVLPTAQNVIETASNAVWTVDNGFVPNLLNQAGERSWPIVGATYILLPLNAPDPAKTRSVVRFVEWFWANGNTSAERLHYVPLPDAVKQQLLSTLRTRLSIN